MSHFSTTDGLSTSCCGACTGHKPGGLNRPSAAETLLQNTQPPSHACRGAAEGEGLGNAFLSHIAAVDGIFHVCRGFEDPDVTHVEDRVDPVEDLDIIHK